MYTPSAFVEADLAKLHGFIESHSFGMLISPGVDLTASHLPFLLDRGSGPQGTLIGHMARANPQWQQAGGSSVLVVFAGPHAYVSPSWYEARDVVPTWNYVAVHVYGTFRRIEEHSAVMRIVRDTVDRYEQDRLRPWALEGSAGFVDRLVRMVVGFEIEITRIEGTWKLSQNHSPERRQGVVQGLIDSADPGAQDVATLMQATLSQQPGAAGECRDQPAR
jgi:transcriptional regulator